MNEFQPPLAERKFVIQEQIDECKKIIWRNNLESRIEKETNAGSTIQAQSEFNNKQLKDKLTVLLKVQAELEKEVE